MHTDSHTKQLHKYRHTLSQTTTQTQVQIVTQGQTCRSHTNTEATVIYTHSHKHTQLPLPGATIQRHTYSLSQTQWNNPPSQAFRAQVQYKTQITHSRLFVHKITQYQHRGRCSHLYNPGHTHRHGFEHTTTVIQTHKSQCHHTTPVT